MRLRALFAVLIFGILTGCATAPTQINNSCAIFAQRDGWINNWRRAAERSEKEFGIPVPILMATIYTESSFRPYARPPRTKILGFIPGKRQSTAYGYSQALDGTWSEYQRSTGRYGARRTNFADAIHFIGWYHNKSTRVNGIARTDAHNLYLAYYAGQAGYARGAHQSNPTVQRAAKRATSISQQYARQMASGCR